MCVIWLRKDNLKDKIVVDCFHIYFQINYYYIWIINETKF